jgi:hypothetical protein
MNSQHNYELLSVSNTFKQACSALWNIAVNADNQVSIAGLGGIEILLSVMKLH